VRGGEWEVEYLEQRLPGWLSGFLRGIKVVRYPKQRSNGQEQQPRVCIRLAHVNNLIHVHDGVLLSRRALKKTTQLNLI
jgi:hypothetical protein